MRTARPLPARLPFLLATLAVIAGCDGPSPPLVQGGMLPRAGGDSLRYRIVGSGPDTVVFLAGGPGLGSSYLEHGLGGLSAGHTLVSYDPRGRGRSSPVQQPDSLTLTQDVEDLEALRSALGIGRMHLVGHHWGANLALLYALRFPQHVGRVVFLTPWPHKTYFYSELQALPHDTAALSAHMLVRTAHLDSLNPVEYCAGYWGLALSPLEETDPGVVRRLAPFICDATPQQLRLRERERTALTRSLGAWTWVDSIPRVAAPALVVVGDGQPALLWGGRAWAGRLREGRMLVAGRTPLFPWLEARAEITRALDEFLGGGWPEGAVSVPAPPDTVTHP